MAGDAVYLAVNDHWQRAGSNGVVVALDAATGVERWRFDSGMDGVTEPTAADGAVYVGSLQGGLTALDATTGAPRWRFAPADVYHVDVPIVAGDAVYANALTTTEGVLLALDATTGAERWRFDPGPDLYMGDGRAAVIGDLVVTRTSGADSALFALDTGTGTERWRLNPEHIVWDPAVADGTIYAGGRGVQEGDPGALLALDPATGEERWRYDPGAGVETIDTPVVGGGVAYTTSFIPDGYRGRVYAFDAATGEERWSFPWEDDSMSVQAAAGGLVFVAFYQGPLANAVLIAFEDPTAELGADEDAA